LEINFTGSSVKLFEVFLETVIAFPVLIFEKSGDNGLPQILPVSFHSNMYNNSHLFHMQKYEVLGVIGEGAYGIVLRCRNT
jgi:hypothetical protein